VYYSYYQSPIGQLLLIGNGDCLQKIDFPNGKKQTTIEQSWEQNDQLFNELAQQLDAYFLGTLSRFDFPLSPVGTEFQRQVWTALQNIAFGDTCSYKEIANAIGKPTATRAVGAANGANPIPLIIPCHRVIGSNGSLTGFGGGLATKQWLLSHEAGEPSLFDFEELSTTE